MNYDAVVTRGFRPWLPNAEAQDLEPLHLYNVPLAGIFTCEETRPVLFICVTGATSRTNVWAYTRLTEAAEDDLEQREFSGPDELEQWIHAQFEQVDAAFAWAKDNMIRTWSSDRVGDGGLLTAAIRFMDHALTATTQDDLRRAEQARVDATRATLEYEVVEEEVFA